MLRTLFLIPHEFLGLPVFGIGWALILLVAMIALRCFVGVRRGSGLANTLQSEGLLWGIFAFVVVVVFILVDLSCENLGPFL